ncbi:chymotrypsin-like elastase family member 2A isoform X2 [Danaus plexippus]|uniref:chymotrypsin-like elastase family member 2A isoform X2 n=1 Tax=Danaus plexippus TaxID=13037 RepID=UPI002AB1CDE1|nr:chymotrypsin-like elastase family member 2A isoform X2 [Danaus plexippus]
MKKKVILLITLVLKFTVCAKAVWTNVGSAYFSVRLCKDSNEISASYESDQPPELENAYDVHVSILFPKYTTVYIKLDSEGSIKLAEKTYARIYPYDNNEFSIRFFAEHDGLGFKVHGKKIGVVPYITSLTINSQEYCSKPALGFLDGYVSGYKDYAESENRKLEGNCGRRKVSHTELIVNGSPTKPGDWPWHTAIYRLDRSQIKYICGGTLISKYFVLTAAHCTSIRGVALLPEVLSVVLGKYNLIGGDLASEEREIHQIIVHEQYDKRSLDNDIALLKLKTEAVFTDYIQPACLWYSKASEKFSGREIIGKVVGWGFDNTDNLALKLRQASVPLVSDVVCIKSNAVFYSKVLNGNKFCGGNHNGTSACNGDSGGAFQVFIPDDAQDQSVNASGAWHVRGIVSQTISRFDVPICDPHQYVVFTDVEKYRSWIDKHLEINNEM